MLSRVILALALCVVLAVAAPTPSVFQALLAPQGADSFLRHSYGKEIVTIHRNSSDHFASLRDAVGDTERLVSAFRESNTLSNGIKVNRSE
jgi:hypothetical protein